MVGWEGLLFAFADCWAVFKNLPWYLHSFFGILVHNKRKLGVSTTLFYYYRTRYVSSTGRYLCLVGTS